MGKIYGIAVGTNFLKTVAKHILDNTEEMWKTGIYVPTGSLSNHLHKEILKQNKGAPALMPTITSLGAEDDVYNVPDVAVSEVFTGPEKILPRVNSTYRRLFIVDAIREFYRNKNREISFVTALHVTDSLVYLFDIMALFEGNFSAFTELFSQGDFAQHWAQSLDFLNHIYPKWQHHLADIKRLDIGVYRRKFLERFNVYLQNEGAKKQIFLAGFTPIYPVFRKILTTVHASNDGVIFLPGFDTTLTKQQAEHVLFEEYHPLHAIQKWLNEYSPPPRIIEKNDSPERANILKAAFAPDKDSGCWQTTQPVATGFKNLYFLQTKNLYSESLNIALIIRNALESPHKTVALTTPNRKLRRMVISILKTRWKIVPKDTAGQSLSISAPTTFMRLVLTVITENFSPKSLIDLFQHPLCSVHREANDFREIAQLIDMFCLRGYYGKHSIEKFKGQLLTTSFSAHKQACLRDDQRREMLAILTAVEEILAPLSSLKSGKQKLESLLRTHIAVCESLSTTDIKKGKDILYAADAGAGLLDILRDTLQNAKTSTAIITLEEYAESFLQLFKGATVRQKVDAHPRLNIGNTLDMKLQSIDILIVGDMNEGTFPSNIDRNPWLAKDIIRRVNLPTCDFFVGISASDLLSFFGSKEIFFTRSEQDDGINTIPSRWWQRFEAVARIAGLEGLPKTPVDYKRLCSILYTPSLEIARDVKIQKPQPCPLAKHRPTTLPVTSLDLWFENPYQIYVQHILRLRPICKIWDGIPASLKGTKIHQIFERFFDEDGLRKALGTKDQKSQKMARRNLCALRDKFFAPIQHIPEVKIFWMTQSTEIINGFIEHYFQSSDLKTQVFCERCGNVKIPMKNGAFFTVTGIVDRIDLLMGERYRIVEYKTGRSPGLKKIRDGKFLQLPLQGYIASKGGFKDVAARPIESLEIWQAKPSFAVDAITDPKTVSETLENALRNLKDQIDAYNSDKMPYRAGKSPIEYMHFMRIKEWNARTDDNRNRET